MNNEAFGWIKLDEVLKHFESVSCGTIYKIGGEGRVPVYTHPADLTDEEILEIASPMFEDARYPSTALDFARAILRKAQESDKIESLGTVNIGGVHFRNGKEVK